MHVASLGRWSDCTHGNRHSYFSKSFQVHAKTRRARAERTHFQTPSGRVNCSSGWFPRDASTIFYPLKNGHRNLHLPVRDYACAVSLVQRVQRARLQTMYTDVAKVRRIKKWLLDEPLVRLKIYLEITEAHLFRTLHARGAAAYCSWTASRRSRVVAWIETETALTWK